MLSYVDVKRCLGNCLGLHVFESHKMVFHKQLFVIIWRGYGGSHKPAVNDFKVRLIEEGPVGANMDPLVMFNPNYNIFYCNNGLLKVHSSYKVKQ